MRRQLRALPPSATRNRKLAVGSSPWLERIACTWPLPSSTTCRQLQRRPCSIRHLRGSFWSVRLTGKFVAFTSARLRADADGIAPHTPPSISTGNPRSEGAVGNAKAASVGVLSRAPSASEDVAQGLGALTLLAGFVPVCPRADARAREQNNRVTEHRHSIVSNTVTLASSVVGTGYEMDAMGRF